MKKLKDLFGTNGKNEDVAMLTVAGEALSVGQETWYQCPMKCEGDKLYNAAGNCPVCNMKLVPTTSDGTKSHHHEHKGYSYHACC